MSGYRTLHRIQRPTPSSDDDDEKQETTIPIWGIAFSPCEQSRPKPSPPIVSTVSSPPLRLLSASGDGNVSCHLLIDKTQTSGGGDMLDATALRAELQSKLVSSEYSPSHNSELGLCRVSCIANDKNEEITAAISLDGNVRLWQREEQPPYVVTNNKDDDKKKNDSACKPQAEFAVEYATGTSIAVCPASAFKGEAIVAVGCRNGSVVILRTGLFPSQGNENEAAVLKLKAKNAPGTILDQVGEGSSCVMSLCWSHDATLLAVGRKDGIVDVFSNQDYHSSSSSSNHKSSASNSLADAPFRRLHRVVAHNGCVRAVTFSSDGALLFTGGDDGRVHSYDVQRKRVALTSAFVGHVSWILGIAAAPDGHRFATCSSDKTVRIWDVATKQNIHTFDGHTDQAWDVVYSKDGTRLASCGDDGMIQIYSCEE